MLPLAFQVLVGLPVSGVLYDLIRPLMKQLGLEDLAAFIEDFSNDLEAGVDTVLLDPDRGRHDGITVLEVFEPLPIPVPTDVQFEVRHA